MENSLSNMLFFSTFPRKSNETYLKTSTILLEDIKRKSNRYFTDNEYDQYDWVDIRVKFIRIDGHYRL
jgi:hypothetical protein